MSIVMAGIDYNRAGVDIRSCFSFTRKQMDEAYQWLTDRQEAAGAILIATCNRTELWISEKEGYTADVPELLCQLKGLALSSYRPYLFSLREAEAEDHLFRLAAGMESRILGEDQIISQVRDALGKAREHFATDHVLEVLFRQAVTAGKRVKTEVNLSNNDRSVVHQAIRSLENQGYEIGGKKAMVIGNGVMGKLAASVLREKGADVTVTVRQYHSGVVEVPEGCSKIDYAERFRYLPVCDLVVSATSSPNFTVKATDLETARLSHDVILIDLAVPRDIEPACSDLPGLLLYDIDSFEVKINQESLRDNLSRAEEILEQEKMTFEDYYTGRDVLPRIAGLKEKAAEDVSGRMKPYFRREKLPQDKRDEVKGEVKSAVERMMNKLLFDLRDELDEQEYRDCLQAMEKILAVSAPSPRKTKEEG